MLHQIPCEVQKAMQRRAMAAMNLPRYQTPEPLRKAQAAQAHRSIQIALRLDRVRTKAFS